MTVSSASSCRRPCPASRRCDRYAAVVAWPARSDWTGFPTTDVRPAGGWRAILWWASPQPLELDVARGRHRCPARHVGPGVRPGCGHLHRLPNHPGALAQTVNERSKVARVASARPSLTWQSSSGMSAATQRMLTAGKTPEGLASSRAKPPHCLERSPTVSNAKAELGRICRRGYSATTVFVSAPTTATRRSSAVDTTNVSPSGACGEQEPKRERHIRFGGGQ